MAQLEITEIKGAPCATLIAEDRTTAFGKSVFWQDMLTVVISAEDVVL